MSPSSPSCFTSHAGRLRRRRRAPQVTECPAGNIRLGCRRATRCVGERLVDVLSEHHSRRRFRSAFAPPLPLLAGTLTLNARARPDQPHAAADQRDRRRLRPQLISRDGADDCSPLGARCLDLPRPSHRRVHRIQETRSLPLSSQPRAPSSPAHGRICRRKII